jgi:hypothetical protein
MVDLETKNKELEAKLAASELKHSQEQLESENCLQKSMSINQQLFVESIKKSDEIKDLKGKLIKCQNLEMPNVFELESDSTNASNIEQSSCDLKLHESISLNKQLLSDFIELESDTSTKNVKNMRPRACKQKQHLAELMEIAREKQKRVTRKRKQQKSKQKKVAKLSAKHLASKKSLNSPEELVSGPSLIKKQWVAFLDTYELARKIHIAVFFQKISYELFASMNKMNRDELVEMLENSKPWHLLDEVKRQQYADVNAFIYDLNLPEVSEVVMWKSAINSDDSLNTDMVAIQIKYFFFKSGIVQYLFAKKYLCTSQGRFDQLLREPVPWAKCSEIDRKDYRCCYVWVNADEEAVAKLKNELKYC